MPTRPPLVVAISKKGKPLLVELTMRESQTAPGRLKIGMEIPTEGGFAALDEDGVQHALSKVPNSADLPPKIPICPEFRLEMN